MNNKPLAGLALFLGAGSLSLSTFMQVLDYSIANVSIPYIAGSLAVSVNDGTWVITMFAVGNAIALPLTGWLTQRFGSSRIMVLSVLFFTIASWLCGLSVSINMLVIMRFIQGFVAGPLIPLSQSLMITSFSKEKRNLALAIWNMVAIVGPIIGPILGGWISYNYSWPWIFFINIPVGIFCVIAIRKVYKERETPREKIRVDAVGIILLAIGVSSLQILLDQGQQLDWWRSNIIWILAAISIIAFTFMVIWELNDPNPAIDLRFFKNRNFTIGTILITISYMILFGVIVISPLWLQEMMGYTATWAGLGVSSMGVAPFLTVLIVAKLMDRYRLKYLVLFTFLSFGFALFLFTTFNTNVTFHEVLISRFIFGIGLGTWMAPLTAITFSYFPHNKLAAGQGVFHFIRILMGGIGTSCFVTMWERRATYHHSNLVDSINPYNPVSKSFFYDLSQLQITGEKAFRVIDDIVWKQAYMLSTNDIFWTGAWAFVILFIFTLFLKKKKQKIPVS